MNLGNFTYPYFEFFFFFNFEFFYIMNTNLSSVTCAINVFFLFICPLALLYFHFVDNLHFMCIVEFLELFRLIAYAISLYATGL